MATKDNLPAVGDRVMEKDNAVVEGGEIHAGLGEDMAKRVPEPTGSIAADIRTLFEAVFGKNQ